MTLTPAQLTAAARINCWLCREGWPRTHKDGSKWVHQGPGGYVHWCESGPIWDAADGVEGNPTMEPEVYLEMAGTIDGPTPQPIDWTKPIVWCETGASLIYVGPYNERHSVAHRGEIGEIYVNSLGQDRNGVQLVRQK